MVRPALVTGFMPYGGRGVNPAAEIAAALDGTNSRRYAGGLPAAAGLLREDRWDGRDFAP